MAKVAKFIVLIIVSIVLGFIPTYLIADYSYAIGSSTVPYFLWGIFTIIIALALRGLFSRVGKPRRSGSWEPPEQMRDKVISTPQFFGRFDRERGLLDSTARLVDPDYAQYQSWFMAQAKQLRITRFRGELLDQNGVTLDEIPVEIMGDSSKWIGNIVEGDRIRVEGKFEDDGILHAKNAFNYSTNSWVGERR